MLSSISPALPQCCLVLQNDHKFQETLTVKEGRGGRGGGGKSGDKLTRK